MDMSVTEKLDLAARLSEVEPQAKYGRQRWKLISRGIRRRLENWSAYSLRKEAGELGGLGSVFGAIADCQGDVIRGTNNQASGMPEAEYETEKAFQTLSEQDQEVILVEYMSKEISQVQRANKLGVTDRTYRRRLTQAHKNIYAEFCKLNPKAAGAFWNL